MLLGLEHRFRYPGREGSGKVSLTRGLRRERRGVNDCGALLEAQLEHHKKLEEKVPGYREAFITQATAVKPA